MLRPFALGIENLLRVRLGNGSAIAGSLSALFTPLAIATFPGVATASTDAAPEISEIVVTAEHRRANAQTVPVTLSAALGETLATLGVGGSMDLPRMAPGLVMVQTPGTASIYIRGVGTQDGSDGEEGSSAIYVDGVYIASLSASIFPFNNIERVEILKGPQGTLYGRNATGGLIHVITRDPTESVVAEETLGYANYNTFAASSYLSGRVADSSDANIALNYRQQADGWGRNLLSGRDIFRGETLGARAKLRTSLDGNTESLLSFDYISENSSFNAPRSIAPGAVNIAGEGYLGARYLVKNNAPYPHVTLRSGGASLRVSRDLGWAQLVSLTAQRLSNGHQLYDQDGSGLDLVSVDYLLTDRQFSEELKLQSNVASPVQWVAGLYLLRLGASQRPLDLSGTAFAAAGGRDQRYGRLTTQSEAAYAQVTAPIGWRSHLTAGLRYTQDRRQIDGEDILGSGVTRNAVADSRTYGKLTYRLAVDHNLGLDTLLFASLSRGFKSGIYPLANLTNPPVRPETLDAVEAGFKWEGLDRRLRFNGTAWAYKYQDIQLSQSVQGGAILLNAASAQLRGLDFEALASPGGGLTLNTTVSLVRGRYGDFPGAPTSLPNPIDAGGLSPAVRCAAPFTAKRGGNTPCVLVNAKGNTTIRSPSSTYSLSADFKHPTRVGLLGANVHYYHSSSYYYEPDNRIREPAYGVLGAEVSWSFDAGHRRLVIWGENLADTAHNLNISTSIGDNFTPAAPRTFGLRLELKD